MQADENLVPVYLIADVTDAYGTVVLHAGDLVYVPAPKDLDPADDVVVHPEHVVYVVRSEQQDDSREKSPDGNHALARVGGVGRAAGNAAGKALAVAGGAAAAAGSVAATAGSVAATAGSAALEAAGNAAEAVGDAAKAAGSAMKRRANKGADPNRKARSSTKYAVDSEPAYTAPLAKPNPVLDDQEYKRLYEATKSYERLSEPGMLAKLGESAGKALDKVTPDQLKLLGSDFLDAAKTMTDQQIIKLFGQVLKQATEGFTEIETRAARLSLSTKSVLSRANDNYNGPELSSLDELCFMRAYEVERIADGDAGFHLGAALAEGVATGVPGVAGIPFNITLSMFLYYRAVQSIAMCYGYDPRNNPSDLVIAGQVLAAALGGEDAGGDIAKFMAVGEIQTMEQAAKKGYAAMIDKGGLSLLVTQIRALANKAAAKALEKAGEKGLEESVFRSLLEQLGKKLAQKNIVKFAPVVSGVIGGLWDTATMNKVVTYANIFYLKLFIEEKEERIDTYLAS